MRFTKMEGLGNDYVYVNCFSEKVDEPKLLAKAVSDRHTGIGSDGLILIGPSETADFRMDIYNADGSRAEMCGNGIRCAAKYVYDHGLTDSAVMTVETLAGIRRVMCEVADGRVNSVTVDMGSPGLLEARMRICTAGIDMNVQKWSAAGLSELSDSVCTDVCRGCVFTATCVSMGNPHAVIFVRDADTCPVDVIGPAIERHEMFPDRVNVEFAEVLTEASMRMRVWERGSGETRACGTGACAAAYAGYVTGRTGERVTVVQSGGSLDIRCSVEDNKIYMTGPARAVYDGRITEDIVNWSMNCRR